MAKAKPSLDCPSCSHELDSAPTAFGVNSLKKYMPSSNLLKKKLKKKKAKKLCNLLLYLAHSWSWGETKKGVLSIFFLSLEWTETPGCSSWLAGFEGCGFFFLLVQLAKNIHSYYPINCQGPPEINSLISGWLFARSELGRISNPIACQFLLASIFFFALWLPKPVSGSHEAW